jgi:hypothetical protein
MGIKFAAALNRQPPPTGARERATRNRRRAPRSHQPPARLSRERLVHAPALLVVRPHHLFQLLGPHLGDGRLGVPAGGRFRGFGVVGGGWVGGVTA